MNKEEFLRIASENDDFAPGWDAIEQEFARIYPGQNPLHFGTDMHARAMFGGNQFLDGYSVYISDKGYMHIVTYGMTVLYVDENAFGGEWNGWGYEMTVKIKGTDPECCMWAINLMANLARYTYVKKQPFAPMQRISGGGCALDGSDSAITALLIVPDTEANTLDTVYGQTEFLQLVGITEHDYQALRTEPRRVTELVERMKAENPDFVTDMKNGKSYLKD